MVERAVAAALGARAAKPTNDKPVNGKKKVAGRQAAPISERRNGNHKTTVPFGPATSLDTRQLLVALSALKKGDFSVRLPIEWEGVSGKIADTFNEVIELNDKMARELDRLSRMV